MTTLHWYDSQKYASLTNHMWGGAWTLANKDAWGALPAPIATVVPSRLDEAALAERRDFELLTGALQDKLTRQGLAFNQCERDSFRAKLAAAGYYARRRDAYGVPVWSAAEAHTGRMG